MDHLRRPRSSGSGGGDGAASAGEAAANTAEAGAGALPSEWFLGRDISWSMMARTKFLPGHHLMGFVALWEFNTLSGLFRVPCEF